MNQKEISELVKKSSLRHIAFIMDGNGRWATNKLLPRELGHLAGAKNFKTIARYCRSIGIQHCTVYAFSTENWNRPQREVETIMQLLEQYLQEAESEDDVAFRFIGDKAALSPKLETKIAALEAKTQGNAYTLNVALNYGGRAEILRAVNQLLAENKKSVSETDISSHLYTAGQPDPDLVVRTGNELRISNFLLWQSAYSEFYFSEKMWPDFSPEDVNQAILAFSKRKRRFGGLNTV